MGTGGAGTRPFFADFADGTEFERFRNFCQVHGMRVGGIPGRRDVGTRLSVQASFEDVVSLADTGTCSVSPGPE